MSLQEDLFSDCRFMPCIQRLLEAATRGNVGQVRRLIDKRANVNFVGNGSVSLCACTLGHIGLSVSAQRHKLSI